MRQRKVPIWNVCHRCGKAAIGVQHYERFYHACRNPLTGKSTWRMASGGPDGYELRYA